MPKLSDNDVQICKGKPTVEECYKSLQLFESKKSPGNDGLTVQFQRAFWGLSGQLLVDSLNYSYDDGEPSNSQKEAIITLIEKKDKDKRDLSNWRPISPFNVDVKNRFKNHCQEIAECFTKHHTFQSICICEGYNHF